MHIVEFHDALDRENIQARQRKKNTRFDDQHILPKSSSLPCWVMWGLPGIIWLCIK